MGIIGSCPYLNDNEFAFVALSTQMLGSYGDGSIANPYAGKIYGVIVPFKTHSTGSDDAYYHYLGIYMPFINTFMPAHNTSDNYRRLDQNYDYGYNLNMGVLSSVTFQQAVTMNRGTGGTANIAISGLDKATITISGCNSAEYYPRPLGIYLFVKK